LKIILGLCPNILSMKFRQTVWKHKAQLVKKEPAPRGFRSHNPDRPANLFSSSFSAIKA